MEDFLNNLPELRNTDFRLIARALYASGNGVVITDHRLPDEPIIYCNKAFEDLTGYSKKEIIGRNCRFLQAEDRDQDTRQLLKKAIDNGEHCQVMMKNYKKNGQLIWNELMISPVSDDDGTVTHYIGIQNDVTEKIAAEQDLLLQRDQLDKKVQERTHTLEESETLLSAIVETVRECLLVLDGDLKIVSMNQNFRNMFEDAESSLGREIFQIGKGQWDKPELRELLTSVLPGNNPFEGFELEHDLGADGKKTFILNARQMTLKGKYQNNILLAIEDVTETRALEYRKEDFINIASHEMRTPMTSIKGNLQLLEKIAVAHKDHAFVKGFANTAAAVGRLERLIFNLLDVARMQSGKVKYTYERFNLSKLIQDAIEMSRQEAPQYDLQFSGTEDLFVVGDAGRIEQVMLNLLSNAIKYSAPADPVRVHLSALSGSAKVTVADSGLGVKKKDHEQIFERFYRTDEVAEKFPGVGVGLYVCRQIIKEHQGSIWVESEGGKGATFSFMIPLNPVTG